MSDDLLTLADVRELPQGTAVQVLWGGDEKRGWATYYVDHCGDWVLLRSEHVPEEQWPNVRSWAHPLSFVGSSTPYNLVRLAKLPDSATADVAIDPKAGTDD